MVADGDGGEMRCGNVDVGYGRLWRTEEQKGRCREGSQHSIPG